MLELALGNGTQPATLVLGNHHRKMVTWANKNLSSIHLVSLRASSLPTVDPSLIVLLTLIDPFDLPSLDSLAHLTHLTIAFSLASHPPQQRKLSSICPPGVESITLIRAPVEVNQLPNACTSLSVTRRKDFNVGVLSGSLMELRLDDCNINDRGLVDILTKCPKLETLELPNNKPWLLEGLEELCLNAKSVPHELLALKSLKRLRLNLTQPPAGAAVPPFELVELVLWKCLSEDCKKR